MTQAKFSLSVKLLFLIVFLYETFMKHYETSLPSKNCLLLRGWCKSLTNDDLRQK